MKIVVVSGFAKSLISFRGSLLKDLVSCGHEVYALAPASSESNIIALKLAGINVKYIPISLCRSGLNPFMDLQTVVQLLRVFLRTNADLVFPYTVKPVIYSGIAVLLIRVFSSRSNPRFMCMITGLGFAFTCMGSRGLFRRLLRHLILSLYRLALLPADHIVFQNIDDLSFFERLQLVPERTYLHRVWGSGVSLDEFKPHPLASSPVFLMLGRILADKGVREYVKAARIVKRFFPKAVFRLAGSSDINPSAISKDELDAWVKEGVIEYLGDLNNVQDELGRCRFYVLPSYREGMPRSVLEALAMARPIITTDVSGCRDTVVHGVNGLLVPPRSSIALAEAMIELINKPEAEIDNMARASLALARERFDVQKVNSQLLKILNS